MKKKKDKGPRRQERRFVAQSSFNPWLVRILGGLGASALLLGEPLESWKIFAGLLVMGGLALNLFWGRRRPKFAPVPESSAS